MSAIKSAPRFCLVQHDGSKNEVLYGTAYDICRRVADIFGTKFPFRMYDQISEMQCNQTMTHPDVGLYVRRTE